MTPPDPTARPGVVARVRERVRAARARRPWFDHAVRAYDRNSQVLGSQLAAAITYFGFLSFFPLLALAFAVLGYVSALYPQAQDAVTRAIADAFPSLIGSGPGRINIQDIIDAKGGAGLFGLLGLLYSGLGWLDALRDALRRVFGTSGVAVSFVKKKLVDLLVLVSLGGSLLASLVVTSLATAATEAVLGFVDLQDSSAAIAVLKVLSVGLALLADTVLFAILLSRLSGARLQWRQVRSGALLGAVGFEVLKLVGTFLVGRTTQNPVYATFGVVVGLLVWINLVSKLLMFAAAWTATTAYSLQPVVPGEAAAGRSTGLAAATEPVSVVVPRDFRTVRARSEGHPAAVRRRGRRQLAVGAVAGAGLVLALTRRRGSAA
jgi:membrane protein